MFRVSLFVKQYQTASGSWVVKNFIARENLSLCDVHPGEHVHWGVGAVSHTNTPPSCCSRTYDIFVKIDGQDKKVGAYDSAGSFGQLALMYNMPHAATIVTTSHGMLWAMVRISLICVEMAIEGKGSALLVSFLKALMFAWWQFETTARSNWNENGNPITHLPSHLPTHAFTAHLHTGTNPWGSNNKLDAFAFAGLLNVQANCAEECLHEAQDVWAAVGNSAATQTFGGITFKWFPFNAASFHEPRPPQSFTALSCLWKDSVILHCVLHNRRLLFLWFPFSRQSRSCQAIASTHNCHLKSLLFKHVVPKGVTTRLV